MQKFLKTDLFVILILFLIFIAVLPFFYMHQGLFTPDTGRELYISKQVMLGDVLYKGILNIYGPFSYQFNAVLFKIFGDKISTLYNMGIINSFIITVSLYIIARNFLRKSYSFLICVLSMFSLVFTTFLFNSNITYSYGVIYGLSSFVVSLLFLINFIKTEKKYNIYLAAFFSGIAVINKYEFILYPLVIAYVLYLKPIGIKDTVKTILSFLVMPVISFGSLFIQGLCIKDIIAAVKYMVVMANSESMRYFYSVHGNFFEPHLYLKLILKNPILTAIGFIPLINIALFIAFFKKIKENKTLLIFCIAVILASYKFILYLNMEHMGVFFFPICFLMLFTLCENFKTIDNIKYIILVVLIIFFAYSDFNSLKLKVKLPTPKGDIYMYYEDMIMMKTAIDYAFINVLPDEKIVVLPEGAFVNYITDKKTDGFYHNLTPPYYKYIYTEETVLNHFDKYPADYFVILPVSTGDFGSPNFCVYAKNFCEMINNKYNLDLDVNNIRIYKRK